MEVILQNLPLPKEVAEALAFGTGTMGSMLHCVKAYEQGDWLELKHLRLAPSTIRDIYLEAIEWANHFSPVMDKSVP